ncbi:transient receptor potential cation channel subfamily A member 1a [Hypanus sabinus]|uniref:transient receptor potential cation channel subfamily A member 1a n=1 Tax=Hypanus sabinus TaxID=79690 RepID=UPI0028C42449|nr:transient receptor potential cation channel subfamily A member 1a [Hypanus sabinus]
MQYIITSGQQNACSYSSIQNMDECSSQKNFNIFKLVDHGDITRIEKLMEVDSDCLSRMDEHKSTPLHHAAGAGHHNILTLIIEHTDPEVLNVIDSNGNTPLHWAAEKNQVHVVQTLLDRGANPNILNNMCLSPLHVAVSLNHNAVVKTLASQKATDLDLEGDLNNTPVMLACSKDNSEGLSILLKHGALLCKENRLGRLPIHEAAFSGANRTLEIIIQKGEEHGYSREKHSNFLDKGLHTPLHLALLGGKIETIKTCIENGAKIDLQEQKDKSTPLHFACLQGAFEAVKFMLSKYKGEKNILHILDGIKQTPLHKAATYDSSDLVEYLIEQGADMNMTDSESRTPLLWATSHGAWNTVKTLVKRGANVKIKNNMQCNFLHLTVLQPKGLQNLSEEILQSVEVRELLNDKDINGCTPLHYVCKQGLTDSVVKMLALNVSLHLKTADKRSSLHFAASCGRLHTCKLLLQAINDSKLLNEGDEKGMTPLLLAAQNGHTDVVQLLLRKGALLMRDYKCWTALHYAAFGGYSRTMEVLLRCNTSLLDQVDEKGNTALHLAAKGGHNGAVRLLLARGAAITLNKNEASFFHEAIRNKRKDTALVIVQSERFDESVQAFLHGSSMQCPILEMIEHLPEAFAGLLDICMTESSDDKKSVDYSIEYNFKYLQCPLKFRKLVKEDTRVEYPPLATLNAMIYYNQVDLLNHPVCEEFLKMKWRVYGLRAHVFNMALFSLLLLPITYIIIASRPFAFANETQNALNSMETLEMFNKENQEFSFHRICTIIVFAMCILGICKEIFQILQQRWQYIHDSSNFLDGVMYVTSILFVIPWVFRISHSLQWQCGMISAFTSWVNFLLYLQRFDICGIYVVMFAEILKTLLHIMSIFFFLVFAFGLTFYILLYEQMAYKNPSLSLLRILAMMLGDINYDDNFLRVYFEKKMPFPTLTFTMLTTFMLIIPILLMNLLIGLAVGDIAEVQRTASLKRMAMQIFLHTSLEEKLPFWFLNKVDEMKTTIYPNKRKTGIINCLLQRFSESQNNETRSEMNNQATDIKKLELQIEKQKYRLKDITASVQKQYELLVLIVQKMGISLELEDRDQEEYSCYIKAKRQRFKKAGSKWDLALKSVQCAQKQLSPCSFPLNKPGYKDT